MAVLLCCVCSSEFKQVKELGRGGFSIVFRATHRIDGCEYALKRTKSPVSDNKERNAWLQVRYGPGCTCVTACLGEPLLQQENVGAYRPSCIPG